ncbi:hypothetical protein POPTR_004G020200v4 [Populus trichocarpa]|uniref:Ubiquitin-like domain-containing protein n=1 Tax=Populus trichocarpa TaxID=3694 RepID=A0A2K2ANS6_POPTR|nr:hypothetical protein POPTR_004G020200v4 [Populus trichocarpa]
MDASAQVICGKSQKLETEEGRNLIRNIPDVILFPPNERCCHSILSKRWKNLWMSVPNLDFEEEGIFGDRIQELLPSCDVHSDASHINTWIFAALCCKFQELKLDLYQYNANESLLPHCLFTFQSLTVLELYLFHDLKLLSTICLPNLKELKLPFITFVDDHSTQLFDGCLNLRKVTLDECTWKDEKFVFISSPMLKFLSICDLTWDDGSPNDCQVVTCGTNLKFFSYSGELKTDFCLYSSSLVNGCMDLRSVTVSEWMENKGKLLITCVSFLRGSLVLKA